MAATDQQKGLFRVQDRKDLAAIDQVDRRVAGLDRCLIFDHGHALADLTPGAIEAQRQQEQRRKVPDQSVLDARHETKTSPTAPSLGNANRGRSGAE